MFSFAPLPWMAVAAFVLVLAAVLLGRAALRGGPAPIRRPHDALDTLVAWPPEASRVMTRSERRAYDVLTQAVPGYLVLAQVPLARFLRVPRRHSYTEWLQRVGFVSADLVLCDRTTKVLAVVDVRPLQESDRAKRRHERIGQVLRQAGIHVLTWSEDDLPTAEEVRDQLLPLLEPDRKGSQPINSKPLPLIPVAEMEEMLADGDAAIAAQDTSMEPVPSTLFDDLEPIAAQAGAR